MANKNTGWSCQCAVSISSQDNDSANITVTCYWKNSGWSYDINYVSAWVYCNGSSYQVKNNGSVNAGSTSGKYSMGSHTFTVSKGTSSKNISCYAKITSNSSYVSGTKSSSTSYISISAIPSYTVSYSANGGSGAPGSQTKWYGSNLTLSGSSPYRTGYNFQGWATSSGGGVSYYPGSAYGTNSSITLYAVWSPVQYKVSFHPNGGSGGPDYQTKTYGVNLTLSSTRPSRTNYNFLGWSTSSSGGVSYNPGSTYSSNSAVILYAVWQLAYAKPRLSGFSVNRCNSAGTASESGTYARVQFSWSTDRSISAMACQYRVQTSSTWTTASLSASGTSGSINQVVGGGGFNVETSYAIRVYVSDSGGTTYSVEISLGTMKYPIDIKAGGTGVAFGKVAESANLIDFGWPVRFRANMVAPINYSNSGTSWYLGRDVALIRHTGGNNAAWCALLSLKTASGSWEVGTIYENLCFNYTLDSNYNVGNNTTKYFEVNVNGNVSNNGRRLLFADEKIAKASYADSAGSASTANKANVATSAGALTNSFFKTSSGEWIGFYNSGGSRLGWIGHDGGNYLNITNERSWDGIKLVVSSAEIRLDRTSTSPYIGYFYPAPTNTITLGTQSYRWYRLYQTYGSIDTSDEREKHNIIPIKDAANTFSNKRSIPNEINVYEKLFNKLVPTIYCMNNESSELENNKIHIGFVAQDISKSLSELGLKENEIGIIDHSFWTDKETEEEKDLYGLCYTEFIALNTHMIQKCLTKISALESEIEEMKIQINGGKE